MYRRQFLAFCAAAVSLGRPDISHAAVDGTLTIIVSLGAQRLTVYAGDRQIATSPISSGKAGHATPRGIFSILDKRRHHRSNIYSDAPMPYMQRLTWSGIALHASNHVPSYPASHGCVRMPDAFARELYAMTGLAVHVVIADEAPAPRPIRHKTLFQPPQPLDRMLSGPIGLRLTMKESGEDPVQIASAASMNAETSSDAVAAEPAAPIRMLLTRRTHHDLTRDVQHLLNVLDFDAGEVDGFIGPQTGAALKAFQKAVARPANGVIAKADIDELYAATGKGPAPTGHLYARQAFKPIFDVPVTIRQPERPLGAHLFTVDQMEGDTARWLALSLADRPLRSVVNGTAIMPIEADNDHDTSAAALLDRLEIDAATRQRIGRNLTPGSSLAISDNGLGPETGKGTDFVVLTQR
ncbi:L,D-transpeptidase family protein [Pararhizobium haloflavum]|uniref:L,D-transpeptidase family protein n=1 Tax=Pararhizobium haloflavum TaxID=2037914 RepID=UPI000C1757D6|nr:L,D-transpeptidase family protein [Pararhizobium haloflavum]